MSDKPTISVPFGNLIAPEHKEAHWTLQAGLRVTCYVDVYKNGTKKLRLK